MPLPITEADLHGRWRIVGLADAPVAEDADAHSDADAEIGFHPDGSVTGSTGVNRLRSRYTWTDQAVSFGPIVTTRMTGSPEAMALERAVVTALEAGGRMLIAPHAYDGTASADGAEGAAAPDVIFTAGSPGDGSPALRLRRIGPSVPTAMVD